MIPLNTQPIEKPSHRKDGLIDVHSIFRTIQGEGPDAGRPAVFIRLAGCNLQCPRCFGVGVKSHIPYLYRSYGSKIRLDKVEEGEKILTFDEDFALVETEVKTILKRQVSEWVKLWIAGNVYDVTPEHPFFTTRGLVLAMNLRPGDDVLEVRPKEIISFKKIGDRNPMTDPMVAAKRVANTNYEKVAKKISRTRKRKFDSGELIPTYYLLSQEKREEYKKRISKANRRGGNGNWSGKYANWLDVQEAIDKRHIKTCERCKKSDCRLLIHHKDEDHNNDARDNLIVWCHQCHNQHHQRGYNFWNGKRKDGKVLVGKHNGQEVQEVSKCSGRLPVINLSCFPYPTYLANGMWVHNCDTEYTQGRRLLSVTQIIEEVFALDPHCSFVVLTGGEPFRQELSALIDRLMTFRYEVQVETNGTLPYRGTKWTKLSIICSPKAGRIHPDLVPLIDAYKYVLDADHVDPKDGLPTDVLGNRIDPARPELNRPVYLQPMDTGNPEQNKRNLEATIRSCMNYGYRLSLQLHKIIGLP